MKKTGYYLYFIGIMVLLASMFLGMFVLPSTNENEKEVQVPAVLTSDGLNLDFGQEAEEYLVHSFGLRNEFLSMKNKVYQNVFHTSGVESVIMGSKGYLYFSDTLNDYQGKVTLDQREQFNIVHTLELMQEYVEEQGAQFLFMIAPNKNSVVDEMPYYYQKLSELGNADLLIPQLQNIHFVNLFEIFSENNDQLYHKLDSHWNNLGAAIAYKQAMEQLKVPYEDYMSMDSETRMDFNGDLYHMLYPSGTKKDANIYYTFQNRFHYLTNTRSVEQAYIETESDSERAGLLMFRDSFGNALLPMFANDFSTAVFDKNIPYDFSTIDKYQSRYVILEIAERNLSLLEESKPVFMAPEREAVSGKTIADYEMDVSVKDEYIYIEGVVHEQLEEHARIYLKVSDGTCYELTPQKINDCAYGFTGYFSGTIDTASCEIIVL